MDRRMVRAALAAFGRPDATARIVKRSTTLTVRVDAPDGRYMLRLQPHGRMPLPVVEAELAWLEAIRRETGLRVPGPIAAPDGRLALEIAAPGQAGPSVAALFAWLPGRHKRPLTIRGAQQMGEALGRLHQFSSGYQPPPGLARWDFDREAFADEHGTAIRERLPTSLGAADLAAVEKAHQFVLEGLALLDQEPDSYGMIHADTNPTNWLFERGEVALIDFEVCCRGYYMFDVGRLLHIFTADHAHGAQLCEALLRGYATVRPTPPRDDLRVRTGALMSLVDCVVWSCDLPDALRTHEAAASLRGWLAQIHDLLRAW
jgi:Ser/Thr protein kinase RdoA (MazF antagonist)